MSNSIDRRVVEMQFDNDRFEKNAQTTMGTLEKLKQSLRFSEGTKSFDNINAAAQRTDFSPIEKALMAVGNRFSTFGIVGATIIQSLTNKALELGGSLVHSINAPLQQIKSGGLSRALNLEQAKFMIDGLGVSWEKVYKNVDKAVTGTRFGLDEAAKVASQLVASGVSGIGEMNGQLQNTLDAIADVASMSNRSFEDVGNIFATVASNGKLMTMQLRQFSASGLNVAAALAKQLGKTEEQINDMVSKGKISFEEFAEAMSKAYGGMSKKANDTFSGALSNVKAALSRIGAEFYIPGIEFARKIFVELIPILNNVKASLKPVSNLFAIFTKAFADLGGIREFFDTFKIGGKLIKTIADTIVDSFGQVFGVFTGISKNEFVGEIKKLKGEVDSTNKRLYKTKEILKGIGVAEKFREMISHFQTFLYTLTPSKDALSRFGDILVKVFSTLSNVGYMFSNLLKILSPIKKVLSSIVSTIVTVIDFVSTFAERFTRFAVIIGGSVNEANGFFVSLRKGVESVADYISGKLSVFSNYLTMLQDSFGAWQNENYIRFIESATDKTLGFLNSLKPTDKTMQDMKDTLAGVESSISLLWKAFKKLAGEVTSHVSIFTPIINLLKSLFSLFFSITGAIGRLLTELNKSEKISNTLVKVFSIIQATLAGAEIAFTAVVNSITNGINKLSGSGADKLDIFSDKLTNAFSGISPLANGIYKAFSLLGEGIGNFIDGISGAFANKELGRFLALFSTTGVLGVLGFGIERIYSTIWSFTYGLKNGDLFKTPLNNFILSLTGTLNNLKGTLFEYQKTLKAEQLKKIATAILILAGAVLVMSLIDPVRLASAATAVGALFTMLVKSLSSMQMAGGFKLTSTASAMTEIATALLILAFAMKKLSSLSWEDTIKGLFAIGALLTELSIFANTLSKNSKRISKVSGPLIAISVALNILALAVKQFAKMSIEELAKGLISVGGLLFALSKFIQDAELSKGAKGGFTIVLIATALLILSKAVERFGNLDTNVLIKGIGGLLAALLVLSGFVQSLSGFKGSLMSVGIMMVAISASLVILSKALENMGNLSLEQIGRSLLALGGSLLILAVSLKMMKGTLAGSAALLIATISLIALAGVLKTLGSMSIESIGVALLALGGALAVLGISAALLAPLVPAMVALGVAVALVGVGLLAAGAGITLFAAGIIALSGSVAVLTSTLTLLAKSLVTAILYGLSLLLTGLQKLAPTLLQTVLTIIIGIMEVMRDNIGEVVTIAFEIVTTFLDAISEKLPELVDSAIIFILTFIEALATSLDENADRISDAVTRLIISIVKILWGSIKKLASAAWEMIKGIKNSFEEHYPEAAKVIKELPKKALEFLKKKLEDFKEKGREMMAKIKEGIDAKVEEIKTFFQELPARFKNWLSEGWDNLKQAGSHLIDGLISGLTGRDKDIYNAGYGAGKQAEKGLKDGQEVKSPSRVWYRVAGYMAQGMINGLNASHTKLKNAGLDAALAVNSALDILNTDVDYEPRITPVVDMSNIYKSGGEINRLFNNDFQLTPNTGLNITGNLSGIRSNSSFMLDSTDSFAKAQETMAEAIDKFINNGTLDPELIYNAVREGASMATIRMTLNNRELSRGLKDMGVAFR